MAITALYSASTGLRALSTDIDVIANNLSNAETTAFKASRVNFEDLFYQTIREPGTTSGNGEISPAGIYVGLGTNIANTQLDLTQGSLENTGRDLDVGIQGTGFFRVKVLSTLGDGTAYTRNGNFFVNNVGQLVVGMGDGYTLIPPITVPTGVTNITISQDGIITGLKPNATTPSQIGQITVNQFVNPAGPHAPRRKLVPGNPILGAANHQQSGRSRLRRPPSELSRIQQRRSGHRTGDAHPDSTCV